MLGQLLDEERVAVRRVGDGAHQLGCGGAARDRLHERREVVAAEPAERHPFDRRVAPQLGEGAGVGAVLIGRAHRAEHCHVGESVVPSEVSQQRQRCRIGPVEVFEDHQRRAQPPEQRRDRLEQQPPLDPGLGDAGRVGPRRIHRQLGEQAGEVGGDRTAVVPTVLDDGPNGVDERLVGTEAILRAAPPQHGRIVGYRRGQLADESGLAGAGFAGHEHDANATFPGCAETTELVVPADERVAPLDAGKVADEPLPDRHREVGRRSQRDGRELRRLHRGDRRGGDHRGAVGAAEVQRVEEQGDGGRPRRPATPGLEGGDAGSADPRPLGKALLGEHGGDAVAAEQLAERLGRGTHRPATYRVATGRFGRCEADVRALSLERTRPAGGRCNSNQREPGATDVNRHDPHPDDPRRNGDRPHRRPPRAAPARAVPGWTDHRFATPWWTPRSPA